MIGHRLLHFEVLAKLGEGGMGVVYTARDTHLDRLVAIKVLPAEKVADPERRRRFVQEARAASALNHANIITVHDITQAEGLDFIVMEYVDGKTLDALIPRAGMRLSEVLKLGVQVAGALAAAHAKGIVHRDLKPANVMVAQDGTVKVLDFGLAKLNEPAAGASESELPTGEARTGAGVVLGTAAYMSPEQAEGKPVDARSDIFAFGAVLYEMATGRRAFAGDNWASTMSAVLSQEPKPLGGPPGEFERVVHRCLRKDPAKRFQHMDDVCVALQELKEESDSGKLGAAAAPVPRSRLARRLAYGAVSLIVLGTVAAVAWRWTTPPPLQTVPKLVPLTTYPGAELHPSFSPDGRQVAFAWNGEKEDNFDIYVKLIGETSALRLTTDPAPEDWPAWSPDGTRIAFRRYPPGMPGIWLVSALGGAPQKLTDLPTASQMSWSPDGKWIAVGILPESEMDARGIVLVPADGSEPRRLTRREPPALDHYPAFSPDGRQLAYASCTVPTSCDVFVQTLDATSAPQGNPRQLTRQGFNVAGLAWTIDGRALIYGGSRNYQFTTRLWRVASGGGQTPERIETADLNARAPAVAAAGGRLAFQKDTTDFDIWRYQPGGVPQPFLRSSVNDAGAQFSPDGSKIAFASQRAGEASDLWLADADGSHAVQLTRGPGPSQGSPRWSPDGRTIAFDSMQPNGQSKIYIVDTNGGRPRRVSAESAHDYNPSWSRDGKRLYFCSNRTGRHEVWRTSLDGSTAEQVTDNGGHQALESTDGKTLFYTKNHVGTALFARSLDGGPERQVLDFVARNAFAVFTDGIYHIGRPGEDKQYPIQFYEFSTGASRLLTTVKGPFLQHLSVSPDRKTILFSMTATTGSDLMLLEDFR